MATLAEQPLLILVGLTGVGKTTAVRALEQSGLSLIPLPGRREVTDELIIGYLQDLDGQERSKVTDRRERFEYTRRYRELFPGGMAHALSQLDVSDQGVGPEAQPAKGWLLFDGLRGEGEVELAARTLPMAWFLMLHAPNAIRVERLLSRGDEFDRVAPGDSQSMTDRESSVEDVLASYGEILGEGRENLRQLVLDGVVSLDELRSKLSIVAGEHENYSAALTLEALRRVAPDRTIEARSDQLSPDEIARRVLDALPRAAEHASQ